MAKHYLDFIKSSQRFYRGFIHRLAMQFQGPSQVLQVAEKFNLSGKLTPLCLLSSSLIHIVPADESKSKSDSDLDHLVLLSCHRTLIRLGDLSRWRETELVSKDRNWGPAIGYYELAETIYSQDGSAHHQLAVVALTDNNHFRAVYHFYRALAAENPHANARTNLELEFKKVLIAWDKGEDVSSIGKERTAAALLAWFVRLHAKCDKGEEFTRHEELENEVMSQLAINVKERPLEGTLTRMCLANMAAQYSALERIQSKHNYL